MRNTKQKDLIYNIVCNSDNHFSAEQIYFESSKTQPNISLGTVYRNLNKLVEQKKIRRIKMPNNIDRYDKNFVHSHAICIKCGNVFDIFYDFVKELPFLEDFKVYDYDLNFRGVCKQCQEEEN